MWSVRYYVLVFLLAGSFTTNSRAEVTEKEGSWKYFVERTTMVRDNLAKKDKERVFVDRAFVHFGAGPAYKTGRIQTFGLEKFTMARKIPRGLASDIPGDIGSEPNLPLPVQLLGSAFNGLPLKPEAQLERGLSWSSTLYVFYGLTPDFPFPIIISHQMGGYEWKKQRRCAVIKYTIAGRLKIADHPEWFTQEELQTNRGGIGLKGGGTAYFDPAEGIIVEKEQTVSRTQFGEKLERLKDGTIGWVPTVDDEEIVTIKVALQPEEGKKGTEVETASGTAELVRPVPQEGAKWKYLVKRTITRQQLGRPARKINVDRAFVYYGQGSDKAGGQVKTIPNVVYIDDSNKPFPKYVCNGPPFTLLSSEVLKLTQMSDLEKPKIGSEPNEPMGLFILVNSFFLPLMPEGELDQGVSWSSTFYVRYGYAPEFTFPVTIKHELKGYEKRKGRRYAVIKYTIGGEWKIGDHPEVFTDEELREVRAELNLEGNGTVYLKAGIIVEKEQTVSWTMHSEKLGWLEDGSIGWVPVVDEEHSFAVHISLQVTLPEDPNKARPELRKLWKQVHGDDKSMREKGRGELLQYIKPEMRQEHVEAWLGEPWGERKRELATGKVQIVAKYHCRLPEFEGTKLEGRHLMTVVYEKGEDGLRVVSVEGPHFPD